MCKQAQVARLLEGPIECAGNAQLRESVAAGLSAKGVTVPNFDMVTGSQLVVLASILNSNRPTPRSPRRSTRVFASDSPDRRERAAARRRPGVSGRGERDVDLGALTPAEMVEVQLIVGGDGDAAAKRAAIEALAN
jgi:hypothetical protein